ncbi:uncharacterized protein UTRI_05394 [Ustilago trichophora]|uniref:Tyr recombinase domain-containing protein n=1 Tax=Ustilago trichophora TaxID=86804 RepID=A0A5C3EM09_9BASI|nr:uncharacterized protein UTRI_05394 [Ustilago trichophora]
MQQPTAAFSKELSRCHRSKNICFLEALAVLEALCRFSPHWTGHRRVVIHVDNKNVEYGLWKGSIRDPATQTLFREIFALSALSGGFLPPVVQRNQLHQQPPPSFAPITGLSDLAAFLLWNGLSSSTRSRSATVCHNYLQCATRCGVAQPFPATATSLIEWCAHHQAENKSCSLLKRNLAALKSWHIDLGISTSAFHSDVVISHFVDTLLPIPRLRRQVGLTYSARSQSSFLKHYLVCAFSMTSERLAQVTRGFKRINGVPNPVAKLPITLPLLRRLVQALHSVCSSQHDRRMYRAAFCLAYACFLRAGEFTWEAQGDAAPLTVGSVSFADDNSFATVHLPSSKTDPFRTGVTLTAPAVPLLTCAISALAVICHGRPPSAPLFILEGDRPFSCSAFSSILRQCLRHCGIQPSSYSGHSFRQGAATSAASNGVNDDTIHALG